MFSIAIEGFFFTVNILESSAVKLKDSRNILRFILMGLFVIIGFDEIFLDL